MAAQRRAVLAVGAWLVALGVLWAVGLALADRGAVVTYGSAPPFIGYLHGRVSVGTVLAVVVAVVVVLHGPRFARTAGWRLVLLTGWAASTAFAVLLAATDGLAAVAAPLTDENDYLAVVPVVAQDPGGFLRTFTDRALTYPVHVRGHPPGLPLLLGGLDRLGLGGEWWMAALVLLVGTSSVVAVGVTVRALAGPHGEATVRRALPAVVLAPAALWLATSADASSPVSWPGASPCSPSPPPGTGGPGRGPSRPGWSWGCARSCPTGCSRWARSPWSSASSRGGGLPPSLPASWCWPPQLSGVRPGFWLPDGIAVTHVASTLGRAADRPYLYFLVADLVLLGALVGPAGVGGLTGLRHLPRAVRLLVVVALGAALLGAVSGVERGEVERIWVPLACWVLPAAATLADRRGWLVAQATATIALQIVLVSPW